MKKFVSFAFSLTLSLLLAVSVCAEPHAEWDAEAWEDDSYSNFQDFTAENTVDGGMDTAWQKEAGAMDENGDLEKECFVALSWDDTMELTSVRLWWRSSTRAEASTDGYVIQTGSGINRASLVWSDVSASYAYEVEDEQNGYYVCDAITFASPVNAKHLRILVKRGVDIERGYSPKLNEIEVDAEMTDAPEDTPAPTKTPEPAGSGEEKPAVNTLPAPRPVTQTRAFPTELIPWIVVAGVSIAVIVASLIVLLTGREKK